MFERTTLPDGPRVISARLPGARSLSVAAYVLAGSRTEAPDQCGAAHFMEHLTFKGTDAYPTERLLSEAIEGVGGTNNAATDRESTVYWTRLPVREAERAVDVLGELIVRPRLSDAEIDHEREVIIEEIRSYRDDAAQYVYTVFDEIFFGDTPLGREIAGDEASVRVLPAESIRDFWRASYRPANIVIAVAGDIAHDHVIELVSHSFGRGN
ncbi:MAG: M16 family metallopeptidase, partial [Candidatus Limnocylindrales bacterium]